jgi:hypothetical protein
VREDVPVAPRIRTSALVVALLLVAAACGGRDDPKEFRDRADLPSCGSIGAHRPGDPFTADERVLIECLTDAHAAGTGAELKFTLLDTEGGRAYLWVRTLADGSAEEFLHTLDSEFGDESWQLSTCAGLDVDPSGMPFGTDCADSQQL